MNEATKSNHYWPALVALIVPVGFLIGQATFRYGWLEMALGGQAWAFWIAVVVWLVALVTALRRKHWWALIAAPLALYPIVMAALLLIACAGGDCL